MTDFAKSEELFARASRSLVGGVNSPVRAFKGVRGNPIFIDHGEGPWIHDMDGNRYVDYVLSYGPLILGHAHPKVVAAISTTAAAGTSFGAPVEAELRLAESIQRWMPDLEKIRFVNSGTEATMSALRLARAYTGRDKIVKFEGCYHGHADLLLVRAGSGVATLGLPDSPGVPSGAVADTLVAPFNNLAAVKQLFSDFPTEIAAIIVEPVAGNMGVVPPEPGFLEGLRTLADDHDTLLIFDEVMTGFRVHPGGAQALYDVKPDLTTLGKVIGGGLPVGGYGGRAEIMSQLAPEGPVYQAGTLSGNPLAMQAGLATLEALGENVVWRSIADSTEALVRGMKDLLSETDLPASIHRVGTMFSLFFNSQPPRDWTTVSQSDTNMYAAYFHKMLEAGVYLAPSAFEAAFLSSAHDEKTLELTLSAARRAFKNLA
ncbi:MAG: glutamate-1-semialdehyde 2,1-aminomutase [Anaerolineales bacterium]